MSKEKRKKHYKNKKKKKVKNKIIPSLFKKEASSNWLNFIKLNGMEEKLFSKRKLCTSEKLVKNKLTTPVITRVLSLDCEMVADLNNIDMLARVSIVNFKLECIYDKFVAPTSKVGNYRTRFSGIREEDLNNGEDFEKVREEVRNILYNKILVGHALYNDFNVLKFGHHEKLIRDTATYPPFKEVFGPKSPSLKKLIKHFLNENIQEGEHSSVEDAKAVMKLYKMFRKEWEMSLIKPNSSDKEKSQ